ncbi:T9SS type A sorting domain-containing protein [Bizionia sp. M204]|uniref:T9SS type A sorting domain-containing protein n=2 Tax=unclassified Bizionia TaxID=2626393 RepID=UPI002063C9DF|nr:T9SS type A sorting domain-containing protein [Bizionia sp. M204]UPS91158.1 T9SS type A sorting domain-containing protein [Bizionia sp. M204]
MIKNLLVVVVFLFTNNLFSQTVDVVTGLDHPIGIAISGEEIFIAEHSGVISKADISISNPVKEDIVTNLTYPRAVCLVGDELYFATQHVWKININDPNPTETRVIYSNIPRALIATENELFISGEDRISKIDLNATNPYAVIVVQNIEARILAFALKGDELYFGYANKVSKINITDANPVIEDVISDFDSNIYSLAFFEDTLIVGLGLSYKLMTVDMNEPVLVAEEFLSNLSGQPLNLLVHNNELFIAGGQGDKIFKVENLGTLLSIKGNKSVIIPRIYPNPTKQFIRLSGLQEEKQFELYTISGAKVLNGTVKPNSQINMSSLSAGLYYLKLVGLLQNETFLKVIKQ